MKRNKSSEKDHNEFKLSKKQEAKLQVHIAEYSNLAERITNYLNMQSAFVAGLIVWVTSVLIIWDLTAKSYALAWIGLTGFQLIEVILHGFRKDQYNIALYLEESLKPQVKEILKKEDFWKYQSFVIQKQINAKYISIRDFGEVLLSLILLVGLILFKISEGWTWGWSFLSIIINMMLFITLIAQSIELISIRNKIEKNCS